MTTPTASDTPDGWKALLSLVMAVETIKPYVDFGSTFSGQYARREMETALSFAKSVLKENGL